MEQKKALFGHQKAALERYADKDIIPLFFTMGLGKTRCSLSIACAKYRAGMISALLVIAPNDVHCQWFKEEIPKWLSEDDVPWTAQLVGGKKGQKEVRPFVGTDNCLKIVVVNIDTFSLAHKWESVVNWANAEKAMIILDEATCIKNPEAKRTQRILYSFNSVSKRGRSVVRNEKICVTRCVLTGTPVTNGPTDLWAIMEFLQPNYFGMNWWAFKSYYKMESSMYLPGRVEPVKVPIDEKRWTLVKGCNSFQEATSKYGVSEDTWLTIRAQNHYEGPYKHADELKKLLDKDAMFAKIEDCMDMPEKVYMQRDVTMSAAQSRAYRTMANQLYAIFKNTVMTAKSKLAALVRLQQISSGFIVQSEPAGTIDETWAEDDKDVAVKEVEWLDETPPKMTALLRDIPELELPIIVVTRFTAEAQKLYELLKKNYKVAVHTGWKRIGSVDDFKNGKYDVLIANIASIARGFNLQNASSVLFYSNTYSLELRVQAECRIYRIGQKNKCVFIDYVTSKSDQLITKALRDKKDILDYMTKPNFIEELI